LLLSHQQVGDWRFLRLQERFQRLGCDRRGLRDLRHGFEGAVGDQTVVAPGQSRER